MKVFTHGGVFHADEVLAIATLQYFSEQFVETVRGFNVPENWDGLVLDIGREYDGKRLFDHHQDSSLEATNILVLRMLVGEGRLFGLMCKHLYQAVSDIDTGKVEGGGNPGSLNSIIRSLNNLENGFDTAVSICLPIVEACYRSAMLAIEAIDTWDKVKKEGKVAINLTGKFMAGWKDMAAKEDICFLVEPNPRGGYQVTSINSDLYPVPVSDKQTFRHNSGFMAVYTDMADAVNHAFSL